MATVHIPDELYASMQQQAGSLGLTEQAFLLEAIENCLGLYASRQPELTDAEKEHLRESIAQADRGESVSAEEVDLIFESLFRDLAAGKAAA